MVNPPTLDSVVSAFDDWRKWRTTRRAAVPGRLRQQAVGLLTHHKQSQVLDALKINHRMLKRWQQDGVVPSPAFVTLPNERDETASCSLQVTLEHRLGGQMRISGQMTPDQLSSLVQTFIASQGGRP